jgi:molybdopterin-binding protein
MLALVGILAFFIGSALFIGTGAVWMRHLRVEVRPRSSSPDRLDSVITQGRAEQLELAKGDSGKGMIKSAEVMLLKE